MKQKIKGWVESEAELGSENEENDEQIKEINKENRSEREESDQDLEDLIDKEYNDNDETESVVLKKYQEDVMRDERDQMLGLIRGIYKQKDDRERLNQIKGKLIEQKIKETQNRILEQNEEQQIEEDREQQMEEEEMEMEQLEK